MKFLEYEGERIPYEMIRSKRKTMAVEIKLDGHVILRVPWNTPDSQIEHFVWEKRQWIAANRKAVKERKNHQISVEGQAGPAVREWCMRQGKTTLEPLVAYWADKMGVTYQRITIRDQKTRWGSCSSEGNLNFNWKLLVMPQELLDYVIVHELAHRKELNHSGRFWALVGNVLPDYQKRREALKHYS